MKRFAALAAATILTAAGLAACSADDACAATRSGTRLSVPAKGSRGFGGRSGSRTRSGFKSRTRHTSHSHTHHHHGGHWDFDDCDD